MSGLPINEPNMRAVVESMERMTEQLREAVTETGPQIGAAFDQMRRALTPNRDDA